MNISKSDSGVYSVNNSALDSPNESTDASTPHALTSVFMDLRITNRVYNDSLADQQSAEYTTLKQEVDQLFEDIYAQPFNTTHLIYLGTEEMIFSNGSVIATSRLLFGPTQVNPEIVRDIFLPAYKQIPSPALEIDLSYTENKLSTEEPFEEEKTFSRPPTTTHIGTPSTTTPSMATPLTSTPDIITDAESLTSRLPSTHTPDMSTSVVVGNITHFIHSTSSTPFNATSMHPNTTANSPMNNASISAAPNSTTNEVTNGTTTEVPIGTTTTAPIGTITLPSNSTTTTTDTITTVPNATITASPNGTTASTAPNDTSTTTLKTTFTSIHITVVNPTFSSTPFPTAQPSKTTPVNYSPTEASALVPGWGVALLALAAISLFLLIILIILVVLWCCCPKRRVFVNEPEEMNPPMYYNPDIPMYSTQSTFDTANGKQADVREKPPKIRTGMYVVNK
ncbi:cell wall integrity and stress response component 4 [Megalobrama amblycephala]|uniref:cell wall integrity and stress response component 4 n=1 Tax=Megalobrama amblycephala TaxID=75352 RepID=UPI002013D8B3|nr:cell wall integrity and stress response component 4 [Megalobrama amblycephala]